MGWWAGQLAETGVRAARVSPTQPVKTTNSARLDQDGRLWEPDCARFAQDVRLTSRWVAAASTRASKAGGRRLPLGTQAGRSAIRSPRELPMSTASPLHARPLETAAGRSGNQSTAASRAGPRNTPPSVGV